MKKHENFENHEKRHNNFKNYEKPNKNQKTQKTTEILKP